VAGGVEGGDSTPEPPDAPEHPARSRHSNKERRRTAKTVRLLHRNTRKGNLDQRARHRTVQEMTRVRVISFNTRHGTALDGRSALGEQTELLRETLSDSATNVLLLQECDRRTRRSGGVDQPGTVADKLGLFCHFGANINYQGGHYGTAILTDAIVEESFHHLLPLTVEGELRHIDGTSHRPEQRGLTGIRAGGAWFVCVHASLWAKERAEMTDVLLDFLSRTDQPVVIGGDFNTGDEQEYRELRRELDDRLETPGKHTFPSGRPVARIDRILTRGFLADTAGTLETDLSDHHLIWVDLET